VFYGKLTPHCDEKHKKIAVAKNTRKHKKTGKAVGEIAARRGENENGEERTDR